VLQYVVSDNMIGDSGFGALVGVCAYVFLSVCICVCARACVCACDCA